MTKLTAYQINELHSNGVYTTMSTHPLFSLAVLQKGERANEISKTLQVVSQSPNNIVAASFFMRRYGMFSAIQIMQFIVYEEFWQGSSEELLFGAIEEFGNLTVSTFPNTEGWKDASQKKPSDIVIELLQQTQTVIDGLRLSAPIAANVLWENVFGFWTWQFHVMLDNAASEDKVRMVLNALLEDSNWKETQSRTSKYASYLNGKEPSQLLASQVRKTCCLSKDVPGLMQCTFCPLKK